MLVKRIQTAVLLVLLVSAQLLDGVHDTGHLSTPDDQVCSQCLHGKPRQHAALPSLALVTAVAEMGKPSAAVVVQFNSSFLQSPRSRGPPPAG